MIYKHLLGLKDADGYVILLCAKCNSPARDEKRKTVQKVCSNCGLILGEWTTIASRNAELREFAKQVKRRVQEKSANRI